MILEKLFAFAKAMSFNIHISGLKDQTQLFRKVE